jgi:leucyl aminopeptidase (aminopeptidase T)
MIPAQTVGTVLDQSLGVRAGEQVALLVDSGTAPDVLEALYDGLTARGAVPLVVRVPRYHVPGSEPPSAVAGLLVGAAAAIELTSTFIGSSSARQRATAAGTRYLAMPGVVADTFRLGGPLDVDFDALFAVTASLAAAWGAASTYRLTSPAGTDLRGSVAGRAGRALHGVAREAGGYMCPPDVESGTAPVEETSAGVVVIDGDFLFMGPGPVASPVALEFVGGLLVSIEGDEGIRLTDMIERVGDVRMSNLAEVSMGLNPRGRVCAVPMETEATLGSAHIALGNSIAYGGTVAAAAHLDCVMRNAMLYLDDRPVLADGVLVDT